jgi:hypothetical protein
MSAELSRAPLRPTEVYAGRWTNAAFAPCKGHHWWRGPAEIQAHGGAHEPVAITIDEPGGQRSITIELSTENARWLASRLLEIADHHDLYPPPSLPAQRPIRPIDPETGLPWGN